MWSLALTAACAMALSSTAAEPRVYVMELNKLMGASGLRFDFTFVANGEPLWTPGSTWADVPSWLNLAPAGKGDGTTLSKGSIINYYCPGMVAECELFVFQYSCAGCGATEDGGIPAFLAARGWAPFACAPSFKMTDAGEAHKMTGWRLVVDGNTWTQLLTEADADYVAVAVQAGLTYCDTYTTQKTCDAASDRCEWSSGLCEYRTCGKRPVGPTLATPPPPPPAQAGAASGNGAASASGSGAAPPSVCQKTCIA
ncbi:hypothetical protein DIPPA_07416 [Diplonema papillatum]|nr:hypothetical protein DIPPA_07416 [Diplonema papillatum]